MELPADKYLLQDYRNDLRVVEAPQFIDSKTPLIPVKSIGAGLPRPNSKQRILTYTIIKSTAGALDAQVATPNSTTNIYFLGAAITMTPTAGSASIAFGDATAGSMTLTNTATNEMGAFNASSLTNIIYFVPSPRKCINGLRATATGPTTGSSAAVIYYMEEIA